jgi:hypothetical protein
LIIRNLRIANSEQPFNPNGLKNHAFKAPGCIPTIYTVDPLKSFLPETDEPQPVWPDPMGEVRGVSFSPLYKSVPRAARKDQALYELLVLVDAIRSGRAREREMATREIQRRLKK